ncbi:MAG TPA: SulP family inorganic anion transporter [Candidatus Wunengus sp. YC60]|uniref:SulP family inorganic anion transporter n=1 Tax=Candidatus Wunengus sp. YC60 TaxID=3367697 RepID=UPI004027EFE8
MQFFSHIKYNWKSGLAVSLVSIPLSVSLSVAANASPLMGIITAVWAGSIAAIFGGSNYNIVGPTGALSGMLAAFAINYGYASLPMLAIVSGIIIIVFFALRFEKYIVLIPSSVVHGFTLGVALIIGLNQLNFALGLKGLPAHKHLLQNVMESFKHIGQFDAGTITLFLVAIAVIFYFSKLIPKVPGPIIVAPIGMFLGYLSENGFISAHFQTLHTRFGEIGSKIYQMPVFSPHFIDIDLLKTAFAVAVIAILETLISAKIADNMTNTKSNQRKEMMGLGLANIASGIFGGIPATAALARTALNIKSGANHKTSAAITCVLIGVVSLIFLPYFKYLPLAVVASILVSVAIQMVSAEHFMHIYKHDKKAFALSFVVTGVTLVEDPIFGIMIGAIIALLIFVNHFSRAQTEINIHRGRKMVARVQTIKFNEVEKHAGDVVVYRFAGQLNYINSQSHIENLSKINGAHTVIINFRNLFHIDLDGLDALGEVINTFKAQGKKVILTSAGPFIIPILTKTGWYDDLKEQNLVFNSTTEALETLGFEINEDASGDKTLETYRTACVM